MREFVANLDGEFIVGDDDGELASDARRAVLDGVRGCFPQYRHARWKESWRDQAEITLDRPVWMKPEVREITGCTFEFLRQFERPDTFARWRDGVLRVVIIEKPHEASHLGHGGAS